jgi:hypothetical protein
MHAPHKVYPIVKNNRPYHLIKYKDPVTGKWKSQFAPVSKKTMGEVEAWFVTEFNPVKSNRPKKIGYETIWPQQCETGEKAWQILRERRRTPIIGMQFQQGKTGCIIYIGDRFIRSMQKAKKSYQVIVIEALGRNELLEQTYFCLTMNTVPTKDGKSRKTIGARLDKLAQDGGELNCISGNQGILVLNRQNLEKVLKSLSRDVDERLIMIDEVHQGNGRFGQIDKALQSLGVRIAEQIHTWDQNRTINNVVGISATAFAHACLSRDESTKEIDLDDPSLFEIITCEPVEEYNGLDAMLENDRIQQVEELFAKNKEITSFGKRILFSDSHKYTVVRAKADRHIVLEKFLKANNLTYRVFNDDEKNIKDFSNVLSVVPNTHIILVIKDCCRAGVTITGINIENWVELNSKASDSVSQAGVGRACGYGKQEETYIIYTNLKAVKEVAAYYSADRSNGHIIPGGIQNRRKINVLRINYTESKPFSHEEGRQKVRDLWGTLARGAISATSEYGKNRLSDDRDLIDMFLNGHGKYSKQHKAIKFDGPNSKHPESWERLKKLRPEVIGKTVLLYDTPSTQKIESDGVDFQKKNSALVHHSTQ